MKKNYDFLIKGFIEKFKIDISGYLQSLYLGMPYSECLDNFLGLFEELYHHRDIVGQKLSKKIEELEKKVKTLELELDLKEKEAIEEKQNITKEYILREKGYKIRKKLDAQRISKLKENLERYEKSLIKEDFSVGKALVQFAKMSDTLNQKNILNEKVKNSFQDLEIKYKILKEKNEIVESDRKELFSESKKKDEVIKSFAEGNKELEDKLRYYQFTYIEKLKKKVKNFFI